MKGVMKGQPITHDESTQCPFLRGVCFKCGGHDHGARGCEVDFNGACKENQLCVTCMLPSEVLEHNYHPETGSYGKSCRSESLKLTALALFQSPAHIAMDPNWREKSFFFF